MKKDIISALVVLLVAQSALAGISFDSTVGNSAAASFSASASSVTVTVNIVSTEIAIACIDRHAFLDTVSGISGGGTWSQLFSVASGSPNVAAISVWSNYVAPASASSIIISYGSGGGPSVTVAQYTGASGFNTGNEGTNNGHNAAPTATLTGALAANSWVVGCMGYGLNSSSNSGTTGTLELSSNQTSGPTGSGWMDFNSGTTLTMGISGTAYWQAAVVELKAANNAIPELMLMGLGQ